MKLTFIVVLINEFAFGDDHRIIKGTNVKEGEFPFMVSVQAANDAWHFCGGSIITPQWILTAAHCIDINFKYKIQFGSTKLDPRSKDIVPVSKIFVHPNYDLSTWQNDIALLKLLKPISFGYKVKAVTLPKYKQTTAAKVPATVMGWGLDESEGRAQFILQKTQLQTVSNAECRKKWNWEVPSTHICAVAVGGDKGTCTGDSGGPLIVNNVQVGIVSFGATICSHPMYPTGYTEVSNFTKYIFATIKKNP